MLRRAMSVQERRARERANRHRLILDTARELAEAEGWDAAFNEMHRLLATGRSPRSSGPRCTDWPS